MSVIRVTLWAALVSAPAWAQQPVEYRLGEWKATVRLYSPPSAVCDAEPQWLYDELEQLNGLLDAFLARASTRGGGWGDQHLPMLEQAVKTLPPVVAAHGSSLRALGSCPFAKSGLYPQLIERGLKLVQEAETELAKLPELMRFTRHRAAVERWEKDRAAKQQKAKEGCAKPSPAIYFAYQDEYGTRFWLFCDGAVVHAAVDKTFAVDPGGSPAQDPKRAPEYIREARFQADATLLKAPQQF